MDTASVLQKNVLLQIAGGLGKVGGAAGAAAAELVVVEEEVAGGFAGLHGQGGHGVIFRVELEHAAEVDVADDVDVVEKKGLILAGIAASGIFEEKPGGPFQAAACVE